MSKLFTSEVKFLTSITKMYHFDQFEFGKPEIVFAGRSNAGKSSIINGLVKKHNLAYISNKPGKTTCFNVFSLNNKINLIDMPGYGYAFVSIKERNNWFKLIRSYFEYNRDQLKKAFILVDAKVGLKSSDMEMISMIDPEKCIILLTKCDRLNDSQIEEQATKVSQDLEKNDLYVEKIFITSAKTQYGLDQLRGFITNLV